MGKNFKDQVFAGYQGWFATPSNRILEHWNHWCRIRKEIPRPNFTAFELYPDVSEYSPGALHKAGYKSLNNGGDAMLFDSDSDSVVDAHFRWMNEFGIDGAALQRFIAQLKDDKGEWRDSTALKVKKFAEKWQRDFYIMYDISDYKDDNLEEAIMKDYEDFIERKLVGSPHYARQDGKPVIALWGYGFKNRKGEIDDTIALINKLKSKNCFVVGGVPYRWRDEAGESKKGWLRVYKEYDMIIPWSVGRYKSINEFQGHVRDIWQKDKTFCDENNIDLQRVIYPGFAWSNLYGHKGISHDKKVSRHFSDQPASAPKNEAPRLMGRFFWEQARTVTEFGHGAYIAMFDEYDEATAIAKAATTKKKKPSDQYFLTLDADGELLSSDFYLRLAGEATRMINEKTVTHTNVPIHPIGYKFLIKTGFLAILGREPGDEGYNAYIPYFKERGGTVKEFCKILFNSDEFQKGRKNLPPEELADNLIKIEQATPTPVERGKLITGIQNGELALLTAKMMEDREFLERMI
jgi:hypothetical protein